MGTLSPNIGRKAVIKVDGDDVTDKCDSGDKSSPESMIASARRYVDQKFFSKT